MLSAYQEVPAFAYPGWRLRIPGGPAGGHYKGFTHNYSTPQIEAQDQYEADRNAGAASHDIAHASPRSPRGVYRGPAEVPPRPNASGNAIQTYGGAQRQRHAGTSIAPGSFPAPFTETGEDAFLSPAQLQDSGLEGLGMSPNQSGGGWFFQRWQPHPLPPVHIAPPLPPVHIAPGTVQMIPSPGSGATSVVAQPLPILLPPNNSIVPWSVPPVSPRPGPTVAAPPDAYMPANQTASAAPPLAVASSPTDFSTWLDQQSLLTGVANKWVLGGAILAFVMLRKGHR
jgi:hypothetical protein